MINELSALRLIGERFQNTAGTVEVGIGDDAAALRIGEGMLLLVTTDCQVEDVHFTRSLIAPADLARKSVAVSVSDIGAMGGVPKYILASLGYTKREDVSYLEELISGFKSAEEEFGVALVGGNLSSSDRLFIDITVLGEAEPGRVVTRKGAAPGDVVYVSGTVGDSALGLKFLQKGGAEGSARYLVDRHIRPRPRLGLGRALAERRLATAMIDVSDGLVLDLGRITVDQGVGAVLDLSRLPLSREYTGHVSDFSPDFYEPALGGGEDYELLFTSPEDKRGDVGTLSASLGIRLTEIGNVIPEAVLKVIDPQGNEIDIKDKGFVHSGN